MLPFVNSFMSWYLKKRIPVMEYSFANPAEVQYKNFKHLLGQVSNTSFGKEFKLNEVKTIKQYQ